MVQAIFQLLQAQHNMLQAKQKMLEANKKCLRQIRNSQLISTTKIIIYTHRKKFKADFLPFVIELLGGITKEGQTLLNNIVLACFEHELLWLPEQVTNELFGAIAIDV